MNFDFSKFIDKNLEVKSVFPSIVILTILAVIAVLLKDSVQFMFIFTSASLFLGFWIIRYFTLSNNENVEKIFIGLKKKGAIDKEREIKYDKRVQVFKSGLFFYNTIFYNENGCNLDEDSIRFSLLHEEGHQVNKQYVLPPLIFTLSLILIPVWFLFLANRELIAAGIFQALLWYATIICFSILFIISMINNLIEPLRYDEYRSDEYAAKMLKEKFNVYQPSQIADNTFKAIRKQFEKTEEKQDSIKNRLLFAFIRYHPRDEDRVKNIREKFDVK
jgi:membrane protein implicated in regulation of membrane protease activity